MYQHDCLLLSYKPQKYSDKNGIEYCILGSV